MADFDPMDDPASTTNPRRKGEARYLLLIAGLLGAAVVGGAGAQYFVSTRLLAGASNQGLSPAVLRTNVDDVARLKQLVPSQSHTMMDVGKHWSDLWFAGQHQNWPLARFYFDEARQHIRWTVLIRPVRQGSGGKQIDIKALFDGLDPSAFAAVQLAIEDADLGAFETTYRDALEACYACHVASEKPYLRLKVPEVQGESIIGLDPVVVR